MIKFVVGLILGFVLAIAYYDGFVALEYKQKIKIATDSLQEAAKVINQKDQQFIELAQEFQQILNKQAKKGHEL